MSSKTSEATAPPHGPSPSRSQSIASRLIGLDTIAATVVLSCGIGILYWIVVRHIFAEDNVFLRDKLAAVREDLYEAFLNRFGSDPLLAPDGLLIIEHSKRKKLPSAAGHLRQTRSLVQGDAALAFYRPETT